jgi:hypothetical protein
LTTGHAPATIELFRKLPKSEMKPMNLWGGPLIDYLLFESFLTASDFGVLQPVSGLEKHRRKLAGRPVVSATECL